LRIADCGLPIAVLALFVAASPAAQKAAAPARTRPMRIVLVGDSTVTDEKGWGIGFRRLLRDNVECVNAAVSGRSSKSYIDEGLWTRALALKGDYYLIQFGHNDEPGKGPERETEPATTYAANLDRYVDEARAGGATPILVTPLARRTFEAGRLVSRLTPYVAAMKAVAARKRVPLVDLDAASSRLVEELGEARWEELSPKDADGKADRTHLNARGSVVAAQLVIAELKKNVAPFAAMTRDEPAGAAVVAADGSGDYTTVQAAIDAVPQTTSADHRWLIFVQPGTYRERVYVQREKRFVVMIGADPSRVTITYDLDATKVGPDDRPIGTFRTPSVTIDADDFTAENITFENAAGPVGQAVAVRVDGDRAVFRNCRFVGWQDTLQLNRGRQYIEDSFIAGHVDFIFGGATAFFERCRLHAWRNGYLTAASTPRETPFGFVFAHGSITGETNEVRTYLGRPWRDFAQVTFLATEMSAVVRPQGWHNWDRPEREQSSRYRESGSTGPGGTAAGRVGWAKPLSPAESAAITVPAVLGGNDRWNPLGAGAHPSFARALDAPLPRPPAPDRSR
jgi:pectinesterase